MRPIQDRVVVITGASSGIGRATAHAFARRGASVVLAARDGSSLQEAAAECHAAGGETLVVPTDVRDEEAVQALADRAAERFGRIDVWINDAGVIVYGKLEDTPPGAYQRVIETNLLGEIHGARAALRYFRRQGEGTLVNLSSMWGKVASPYVGAYVASKYGIRGFSASLRQELADEPNIHVCTILPMSVDTPIFHHGGNYTGRQTAPVPPIVEPARVVRAILNCVRYPRAEVVVGQSGHLLSLAQSLTPWLYDLLVPFVFEQTALGAKGAKRSDGNLFESMPEWNCVDGGWRARQGLLNSRTLAAGGLALASLLALRLLRRRT
ncbi:MAG TPA: SDR family oxidoreductase [Gammaproteobacteria bacterium]|nr:SDR family oxidoreductase [Gammaproteobacteria bacterium]